jgi:hypothetical protein
MKDPGFAVDLTLRGNIRDYVEVYLGHTKWRDGAGTALQLDGDLQSPIAVRDDPRGYGDWPCSRPV